MVADIGKQPGNKDDNRYSSAMIVEESKKAITPLTTSVWELACVAKKGKWALPSHNVSRGMLWARFKHNHPRDAKGNETSDRCYMNVRKEAFNQLVANMTTINDNGQQIEIAEKTIKFVNSL